MILFVFGLLLFSMISVESQDTEGYAISSAEVSIALRQHTGTWSWS